MDTEEPRDDLGTSEQGTSSNTWWPSEFSDKFASVSLGPKKEGPSHRRSMSTTTYDRLLSQSQSASQVLWSTGVLSDPIPNGFYSVIHNLLRPEDEEHEESYWMLKLRERRQLYVHDYSEEYSLE